MAGGERADDGGQQPGVVLDQLRPVPVGANGGEEVPRPATPVHGGCPELVTVVGAQQQPHALGGAQPGGVEAQFRGQGLVEREQPRLGRLRGLPGDRQLRQLARSDFSFGLQCYTANARHNDRS